MPRRQEADYALWLLGHKNIVSLSFVGLVFVRVGGGGDAPTCLMDCYSIFTQYRQTCPEGQHDCLNSTNQGGGNFPRRFSSSRIVDAISYRSSSIAFSSASSSILSVNALYGIAMAAVPGITGTA